MEQQEEKLLQQQQNSAAGTSADKLSDDEYFNLFPPGYRFCPHDYELILEYLMKKVMNCPLPRNRIMEVNLMHYNPEDLIEEYKAYGEKDWFFFTPRDRKYRKGDRPDRAAGDGFWKATGADKAVHNNNDNDEHDTLVGYKKALVFYKGKPPKGVKTNWIMHEYRVLDNVNPRVRDDENDMRVQNDCVLCRVYKKAEKASKKRQQNESVPVPVPVPVPPQPQPQPRLPNDDSTVASEQAVPFPEQSVQQNIPQQQEHSCGNEGRFDQSIQYNPAEPREICYGNDYTFDQSVIQQNQLAESQEPSYGITHNFSSMRDLPNNQQQSYGNEWESSYGNDYPLDQSVLQQNLAAESQEPSYGNDYPFDQSVLQQNLAAESQEPSYGITNNFSSMRANMGFNSHGVPQMLSWSNQNYTMMFRDINQINSNQPFLPCLMDAQLPVDVKLPIDAQLPMDAQLPASSMLHSIQVVDSQPSTIDASSEQFFENMQEPTPNAHDDCINQVIHNCDSVEQPPLLTPQPSPLAQQPPPPAQQPQPPPLKRRRL
ncbi:hypothetical protein HHK36_019795 [Tetracentron sinense]|uniref:NAC domain-containing protein n=1 Tax=Tetracentron sinense TaxID=13715 RepID=A0A834Z1Z5_TETSI|nr:hypothetical protein HHK36_019795 [Tetracentron sinense]